jgi:hypothetical protein
MLVTAYVVRSSLILSFFILEVISSLELSVLTRVTQRHTPLDDII